MTKTKIKITVLPTSRLFLAVRDGNLIDAQTALDKGANMNAQDERGNTPLHIAALTGAQVAVQFLLQSGADRTIKNGRGFTAEEEMLIPIKALFSTPPNPNIGHAGRVSEERKDKGPPQVGG